MGLNAVATNGDIIVEQIGNESLNVNGQYIKNGQYNGSGNQSNGNNKLGLVGGLLRSLI